MIIKTIIFLLIFLTIVNSKEFTVASYNVENLFDLRYNQSEYKEYIPNTKSLWNRKNYRTKLHNIARVIKDINADIIVLQEIESLEVLKSLKKLTNYKYHSFNKIKKSAVGLAILSNYKIHKTNIIKINSKKIPRDIYEYVLKIENITFSIFNNHWPSKKQKESYRILFANKLKNYLKKYQNDYDYILLGDFNSNYNEKQTIKLNKKLNNSYNITGINDILKSSNNINKKEMYNLWYELEYINRFSSSFRNENNSPDNIVLPFSLFDRKKISYIKNSFQVHKFSYLFKNKKIYRWQMKNKYRVHKGTGYSDHLAISAVFSTLKYKKDIEVKDINFNINTIYKNKQTKGLLKNVIVIYKHKNNYIIKQNNKRAIYIYNSKVKLKLKNTYDLYIYESKEYYGLREINKFDIKKNYRKNINIKNLITNANKIDLSNIKYQNELISGLSGKYKNSYLYYEKDKNIKKIRLYSKNKELLPKNGQSITIIQAHLSYFKNKMQIIINKKSEYNVN